ncbi:hypothetical protein EJ04DRAFT_598402 [Polyplosphaeria fusca]|uniref:ABM domain-containing protein n=1 Tax=Polyplosphaeria fusca TaxID=682080 RepID=A0A9P4QI19_9PLEO|nr:hypothetical protein EJ04DRAFT_598402 [Polyplosphaeria fusca]
MGELDIIAIISPKEGKADRVQQLLGELCKDVHNNEPDTLGYHLHRQDKRDGSVEFVMVEKYKDAAALKKHSTGAAFRKLGKSFASEGLLLKPLQVLDVKPVAGFSSRGKL